MPSVESDVRSGLSLSVESPRRTARLTVPVTSR
jgi:hypothetical protein